MLCILEIGCTIVGIVILIMMLVKGSFPVGLDKELRPPAGYVVGGLLTAVLPLAVILFCAFGGHVVAKGQQPDLDDAELILIDAGATAVCLIPALIIGLVSAKKIKKKKKKRRPVNDEYDDYDDQPARRRLDEDEDDYDDRPRRRRRDEEDEDEERPRRRKQVADDDEDERPRRRRRDEDEDDRPRRRRRDDDF